VKNSTLPALPTLSRRQKQCLRLLVKGYTAAEISLRLYISIRMVRDHLRQAKVKLGCDSILQAAVKASRAGLLD